MKITIVCDILGKEDNGTTIATMNLVRHLQKRHDVTILCCDPTKKDLPGYYVTERKKFPGFLGRFVQATGFALARVDRKIVEKAVAGADIVHCLEPFALSMAAIKVAKKHNIPVTGAVHLLPEHILYYIHMKWFLLANWCIYKYWWDHTYRHLDAVHFPTQFDYKLFSNYNRRIKNKKTYIISNGVSSDLIKNSVKKPSDFNGKFVIACCGRYSPEKAQHILIKAMKYSNYANDIQLIFAGQGQQEKKYQKIAKKLPIAPIFKRFPHDEMIDLINYADIIVHPAILETEGISVLESMSCGKAVIVSDAKKSAPRTFGIDEECIFKANSPKDLAKKIDRLLTDPSLIKKHGNKNRELIKGVGLNECLENTEKMLIETLKLYRNKK